MGSSSPQGWSVSALHQDRCAQASFSPAAQTIRAATGRWIELGHLRRSQPRRATRRRIAPPPPWSLAFVYVLPSRSRFRLKAGLLEELDGAGMITHAHDRLGDAGRVVIIE